jgi:hypothetical protein
MSTAIYYRDKWKGGWWYAGFSGRQWAEWAEDMNTYIERNTSTSTIQLPDHLIERMDTWEGWKSGEKMVGECKGMNGSSIVHNKKLDEGCKYVCPYGETPASKVVYTFRVWNCGRTEYTGSPFSILTCGDQSLTSSIR